MGEYFDDDAIAGDGFGYDDDIVGEDDLHQVRRGDDFGTWPEVEDKMDMVRGEVYVGRASGDLDGILVLGAAMQMPKQKAKIGFSIHTTKTGKQVLKMTVKAPGFHQGIVNHARIVAQHAASTSKALLNIKPKRTAVRGYTMVGVAGPQRKIVFKTKVKIPDHFRVQQLAHELARGSKGLNSQADKHLKTVTNALKANQPNKKGAQILGIGRDGFGYDDDILGIGRDGFGYDDDIIGEILEEMCGGEGGVFMGEDEGGVCMGDYMAPPPPPDDGSGGGDPAANAPTADSQSGWQDILDKDAANLGNVPGPDDQYGLANNPRPTDYASAVAFMKDPTFGSPSNLSLEEQFKMDPVPNIYDGDVGFYHSDPSTDMHGAPNQVLFDPIKWGVIYWQGQMAHLNVASYTEFFNNGTYPGAPQPNGGNGSGLELHTDGWYRWRANYEDDQHRMYDQRLYKQNDETVDQLIIDSVNQNFGPLMGRPDLSILLVPGQGRDRQQGPSPTAGMRYDCSNGGFFWFWDRAPQNLKQPQIDAYVSAAQTAWDTAYLNGKNNYAKVLAVLTQDQADADQWAKDQGKAAMAQQSAIDKANNQNAINEANQQSASNVAQSQLSDQQAQFQLAQQQAQLEYDKAASQATLSAFNAAVARGDVPGMSDGGGDDGYDSADEDGTQSLDTSTDDVSDPYDTPDDGGDDL